MAGIFRHQPWHPYWRRRPSYVDPGIVIDPPPSARTIVVPAEDRTTVVPAENRTVVVPARTQEA